jgi:hypothetical protein
MGRMAQVQQAIIEKYSGDMRAYLLKRFERWLYLEFDDLDPELKQIIEELNKKGGETNELERNQQHKEKHHDSRRASRSR